MPKKFGPALDSVLLNLRRTDTEKKRFPEEQIMRILRAAETTPIEAAARQHGVSEQSIYGWNRQFGQMEVADVREVRQLR